MANLTASFYLDKLIQDPSFAELLETQIDDILVDGVIGIHDIPKIVLITIELIQKSSTIIIKQELISDIVKQLILFLFRKFNVTISETETTTIINVIDSSLKLLLTIPVFKKKYCCL
jgi:hypothetical protein